MDENNINPVNNDNISAPGNAAHDEVFLNDIDDNETQNINNILQQDTVPEQDIIENLNKEIEIYKDKYVRLFAEFENYKRRSAKERIDYVQTAGREVIVSMLDVLDDCDRAEKQMNTSNDIEQIKEGVKLVFNKLRTSLQAKGLRPMKSIDHDFDVEKHEAIIEIQVPDKSKKDKVVDEVVKGYYLNDKLIRFAKVVVGK